MICVELLFSQKIQNVTFQLKVSITISKNQKTIHKL